MSGEWRKAYRWYEHRVVSGLKRLMRWRTDQWIRVTQIEAWKQVLRDLEYTRLDALEISPGTLTVWKDLGLHSYSSVSYPSFDLESDALPRTFDVIIADQVFEHLRHPRAAAENVKKMLRDDGIFLVATPFLIRVHGAPSDYTRWTVDGFRAFLEDCGFVADVYAWGNRKCVIANFRRWREYGWRRDLRNEPDFPVNVWAYARKVRLGS